LEEHVSERLAYRPNEVGPLLGLGRTAVFDEIKSGRLGSIRVGRARLIPADAIRDWIARKRAEQAKAAV
jgi:excisionase family DNA binding protein